nr:serine proteinase (EC 3.4.21.-) 2 - nematode (Anisakis simplex) (fragments) [Anisakis simplex]
VTAAHSLNDLTVLSATGDSGGP